MGKGKIQVWHVERREDSVKRLIRGTLKDVEQLLRSEVSIEPCSAEQAHQLSDIEIEEAAQ
jgi:hypothetical protein